MVALLVHIRLVKNVGSLRRSGLKMQSYGLYAVPVTAKFWVSHQ